MKKKGLLIFLLPALATSCTGAVKLEFVPFTNFETPQELMKDYENKYLYSRKETLPIVYRDGEVNSLNELFALNKTGKIRTVIPSIGERKILVVPVYFSDSDLSTLDKKTTFIQNAFFGDSKMNETMSVAEYYNKSSYGQLKLSGEVAPWFDIGVASNNWESISFSHNDATKIIAARAVDYIKENNLVEDLDSYDTDGNGTIDGVYVIYDHPFDEKPVSTSFYWAFVCYTHLGENGLNKELPYVNGFAWTSVNSITDIGNENDYKSYTNYLIHETGHLLGLADYYNTGSSDNYYQPLGHFDMMDYNIGDHSCFSKYLLKWTSPYVVKPNVSFEVELEPFINSGQYLLVPSESYEKSPFGEYLLIEYFVPEGANKNNEQFEYISPNGQKAVYRYPQNYGLKIYHVNANLGYYKIGAIGNSNCICQVNDPDYESKIGKGDVGLDFAYDNSPTNKEAKNSKPVLVHLLEGSGQNTFIEGASASNETLFRVGSDFGISKFTDFTFDDGSKPQFKLKVKSLSAKKIVLDIDTRK